MLYFVYVVTTLLVLVLAVGLAMRRMWKTAFILFLLFAGLFLFILDIPGFLESQERARNLQIMKKMEAMNVGMQFGSLGDRAYRPLSDAEKEEYDLLSDDIYIVNERGMYYFVHPRETTITDCLKEIQECNDKYELICYDSSNGSFSAGHLIVPAENSIRDVQE